MASAALASTERQASNKNGASLRIRSSAAFVLGLAGVPPAIRKSRGQFKRRRLADARSNNERCGRRKFDAVRNQCFLSRALAFSRVFTCDFGATFFHAILSALFIVAVS